MKKHKNAHTQTYKRKALWLVVSFVFFQMLIFATPTVVHAQKVVATIDASVPAVEETIREKIKKALISSVMGSLVNMSSYFLRTLAYDTATYIASGGKGQGSLIFEQPFDEYLAGVALDSVGEAVAGLGTDWGLNLCAPPNLELQAQLKIGLDTTYGGRPGQRPQSSCSWQSLQNNWKSGQNLDVNVDVAADFAGEVNVMETDFGFALGALTELDELKVAQEEAAKLTRSVNDGFKSVTDPISGFINTPGKIIEEEATALTGKQQGEQSAQQIAGLYASELWQVIPMSASVFLNTLTSQLLNRVFTEGLIPSEREKGQGSFDFYGVNSVITKRNIAERAFGFLNAATGKKDTGAYEIVSEFATCPEDPGLSNCVMNQGMKQAIDRATVGRPVTLYDAVFVEGFIHPDTPLISPRRTADNEDINCYRDKLCYSNVQKLRQARILPLGVEIAALRSDPDNPWTIGDVLNGFETCPLPGPDGTITPDLAQFPYCHLVNPNWILRAPEARCENRVYSADLLVKESPRRREECADISTCISEDKDGNCTDENYYGFCTQEKNVWNLPGESCEPEFATCRTFTNQETNNVVSYLTRTLDYGSCGPNTVGCRAYVTEKVPGTDTWIGTNDIVLSKKLDGRQQSIHFNDRIVASGASCPEGAVGCSQFIGATRDATTGAYIQNPDGTYTQDANRQRFIKQAPAYLGCYDTNPDTTQIEYPTTMQQIENSITDDPQCDAFAQVCVQEEVGCELYTPQSAGEAVPGVVGENFCPASCVGYDTFKQEESSFEASVYPLYFISANGVECSAQHVGCDEFTNIGSVETGGEGLEYYTHIKQCEVPDGENSSIYYTWEGSESQGFVLKVHTLAKVGNSSYYASLANAGVIPTDVAAQFSPNAPVYANDVPEQLIENYALCNEEFYTNAVNNTPEAEKAAADCRALYDSDGNVYYRLLADTVTVSDACHPLRKTTSRLVPDQSLLEIANISSDVGLARSICEEKQGYWDAESNSCQRCAGGGAWVPQDPSDPSEGSCVYHAIDAPGESVSCIPEAVGCRAYTGNTGNNIKPVFEDSFEPVGTDAEALSTAKADWLPADAVSIAAESLQVNLHSLSIDGGVEGNIVERTIPSEAIASGSSYELRFWARGASQRVQIALEQGDQAWELTYDPITNAGIPVSVGASWREYRVGPVTFTGSDTAPVRLVFDRNESPQIGVYFIDNVLLYRTDGNANLIQDSWQTAEGYDAPAECFAPSQNPNGPFPGAALGCEAYTTSLGQTAYATGFERLCREEAVGCAPLWDTQNTAAPHAEVYNAVCIREGDVSAGGTCEVGFEGNVYECSADAGESECYISEQVVAVSADFDRSFLDFFAGASDFVDVAVLTIDGERGTILALDESSVFVPADTPIDAPLFLTDTPASACASGFLGCELVALEEQTVPDALSSTGYRYTEQTIINLPSQYLGSQGTLCREDQVACSAFTSTDGQTGYFKDPQANANKLCEYRDTNNLSGEEIAGWYIKDIGTCSEDSTQYCTTGASCGDAGTCVPLADPIPCYSDFFDTLSSYGLWSNGSPQYDGFVGECPIEQNLCTELVDPNDVDTSGANPDGKPYYVLFNDSLTASAAECQGQVSLRDGCVLFDRTDVPQKSFDASATYEASERKAQGNAIDSRVSPVSTESNDANIILSVAQGRECSEWLACTSFEPIQNESGRNVFACAELDRCTAFAGGECVSWVSDTAAQDTSFLDLKTYINRETDWEGSEYTGYSLYNQYQIADLETISFTSGQAIETAQLDTKNSYVGYVLPGSTECSTVFNETTSCADGAGRCIDQQCVLPRTGGFGTNDTDLLRISEKLGEALCKVPPEETSPFPSSIVSSIAGRDIRGFVGDEEQTGITRNLYTERPVSANICQGGEPCACEYTKLSYGGGVGTDYWPSDTFREHASTLGTAGICSGSFDTEGQYCTSDEDCGDTGRCNAIETQQTLIGTTGHCLEYDLSRPILGGEGGRQAYECLTWLPVDRSFGRLDTYNVFTEAGYDPGIDAVSPDGGAAGQVYCTESFGRGSGSYETPLIQHPRYSGGLLSLPLNITGSVGSINIGKESSSCVDLRFNELFQEDPEVSGNIKIVDQTSINSCALAQGSVYEENPYMWYVCGTKFAGTALSLDCDDPTEEYSISDSLDGLYSLMSLWGWEFLSGEAKSSVVLRVEGSFRDNQYGYETVDDSVLMGALVPDPHDNHDSGTFFHPPRFGHNNDDFSYTNSKHGITVNSKCHVAGGCEEMEGVVRMRSTETEKNLNLAALKTVYFVPLRYPNTDDGFNPALLSREIRINFDNSLGGLGTSEGLLRVDHKDKEIHTGVLRESDYALTTYVLEREEEPEDCAGLYSFCDYVQEETVVTSHDNATQLVSYTYEGDLAVLSDPRNTVYTRYVAVAYAKNEPVPFVEAAGGQYNGATSRATDPFTADCSKSINNFFAIGMDFNEQGEFLGYISRHCHSSSDGNGIQFAVIATMYDQCSEFTSVYRDVDPAVENSNMAWTNRVWKASNFSLGSIPNENERLPQETTRRPFGSLSLSEKDILHAADTNDSSIFTEYAFTNSVFGVSYDCDPSLEESGFGTAFFNKCKDFGALSPALHSLTVVQNGTQALMKLFAAAYGIVTYPYSTISVSEESIVFDQGNATDAASLKPPQVYSLNPSTCFPSETSVNCTVGEQHNITIGSINGTSADYDRDTVPDEGLEGEQIIATGSYLARARFFAFADDNRMPIRRVMVNWGDGKITNEGVQGLYKNRKPLCESTNDPGDKTGLGYCRDNTNSDLARSITLLTCDTDADCSADGDYSCIKSDPSGGPPGVTTLEEVDTAIRQNLRNYATLDISDLFLEPRFGNLPRACQETPFEYYHTYGCEEGSNAWTPISDPRITEETRSRILAIDSSTTNVCIYRPAVQVLDNWGWCNGTCDGTEGCQNKGGFSDQCERLSDSDPWTTYQGLIVVVPN